MIMIRESGFEKFTPSFKIKKSVKSVVKKTISFANDHHIAPRAAFMKRLEEVAEKKWLVVLREAK